MICAARQIQEKSVEQNQDLYISRSKKNLQHHEQRWTVEDHVEIWPDRFVKNVGQFHDGMMDHVLVDENVLIRFRCPME